MGVCVCVPARVTALTHFSLLRLPLVNPPDNRSPSFFRRAVSPSGGDGCIIQADNAEPTADPNRCLIEC